MRTEGARDAALVGALFNPRGVALIGASDDASKIGGRPLRYLLRHGFTGPVYPINPRRRRVMGALAYPDLASVPGPIDHAHVLVPTAAVIDAVAACGAAGVPVASILASGFAEAGREGIRRQARLMETARRFGVRVIGPSCLGVVDTKTPLALTANAAFEREALPTGPLMVISQSGSLLGALLGRGAARGLGFSKLVSIGNEADVTVGELGAACVDDPETGAFLLFLETIRDRDALARFARAAFAVGKPVIAYKLGRSRAGQAMAVTHTGALVASDAAVDAFLESLGIIRVDHFEALLEVAPLAIGRRPWRGKRARIGVVTTTGGGAAMAVDRMGILGLDVAAPAPKTRARLAARDIDASGGPVVDLTLAGARPDVVRGAIEAMLDGPEFAAVLAVVGSSASFKPELAVKPIAECAGASTPVCAFVVPEAPESLRLLAAAGIAAFRTPESCADALRAFVHWRAPKRVTPRRRFAAAEALLASYAGRANADEWRAREVLSALGVPFARAVRLAPASVKNAKLPFPFPVAAKIVAPDAIHKTEIGGVALEIADRRALVAAADGIVSRFRAHTGTVEGAAILVAPMVRGLAEVLVGYRVDAQAGPVVVLGAGGITAELGADLAVRVAPVTKRDARAMIADVASLAPVRGFRGLPKGDVAALANAISALSNLAHLAGGPIVEAEVNPLIVRGEGVVAVDAVLRLAGDRDLR
ncbi:MAG: acetate--CoA ligase family protein [Rhodospirillales bacterium]|nr:acetate--CoA ligase family protein [Rhodospirillales bacterium]